MNPTWLIEADTFPDKDHQLIEELKHQNIPHVVMKFGKSYEEYLKDFHENDCIIFHGSLQFGSLIRKKTNWTGIYCNLPKFECSYYYSRFGEELLNSNYVMLPFGELNRRKDWLFANIGINNQIFVRPSSGFKTFTGKVTSLEHWEKDYKLFGFYGVDPHALVVVAPPSQIKREWRLVVADNKVLTGVEYKTEEAWDKDKPSCPPSDDVIKYAQFVVDKANYKPDPVWTIDICETDSGFKIVEVGSFSCAGLYGCPSYSIVEQVNRIAKEEWATNK